MHNKELTKEFKRKQHEEFEKSLPMSIELFNKLFDFLDNTFQVNDCDDTLQLTLNFLKTNNINNDTEVIEWIKSHGGYCDCEVLANVEELFD